MEGEFAGRNGKPAAGAGKVHQIIVFSLCYCFTMLIVLSFLPAHLDVALNGPLRLAFVALVLSHVVSFGQDFTARDQYTASIPFLMLEPYLRTNVLYLTIILGSWAAPLVGRYWAVMVIFVAVKTYYDFRLRYAGGPGSVHRK